MLQVSDGVLGFVKASQLVDCLPESTPSPHEVGSGSFLNATTKLPTSFVPASKLVSVSRTASMDSDRVVLDDAICSGSSDAARQRERDQMENPIFGAAEVTSKESQPGSAQVGRLKRVKVDLNDLFEDDPTSSEEESSLSSVPRVSGPAGMLGFRLASTLSVSSLSLRPSQQSTVTSSKETQVSSSVPVGNGGRRGKGGGKGPARAGHTKPLPKISNFFEK